MGPIRGNSAPQEQMWVGQTMAQLSFLDADDQLGALSKQAPEKAGPRRWQGYARDRSFVNATP